MTDLFIKFNTVGEQGTEQQVLRIGVEEHRALPWEAGRALLGTGLGTGQAWEGGRPGIHRQGSAAGRGSQHRHRGSRRVARRRVRE